MLAEELLCNHGGRKTNDFLEILNLYLPDPEIVDIIPSSPYYFQNTLPEKLNNIIILFLH